MAIVEKRSVSLSVEIAAVVDQAVAGGEFGNASEVIREALRQWKERRDLHGYTVEEVRLLWDEGIASGEARPMTETFSEIIKRRGRERLASGN
ncbi:type II toxin-antitoxin system ParD family antitoxin [Shinella curvata]|uniref:Type II toxin-antitoxin system ParD family antitoxin n=1 Tax=Shinella curvata TaxID=1817964 RepID=A0ABT8XKR1_9HYPH|nr:type II toxin-antitoxin system ParD family antitoxin [Shinella curvata]MCJ8056440.1 type II toxin-antitoxin system ParD family antitoxin [Shinella curvata]MDO6124318.1 type II toxin-antitoxin system ParD family antitoxin [Shinella curvata]